MTNKETLRYLVTEVAGATLSEAEWAQVEAQAETCCKPGSRHWIHST